MTEDKRWLKSTVNDLNNLLQEISGYVHLAHDSAKSNTETVSHLASCRGSIQRATDTVRSILAHLEGPVEKNSGPLSTTISRPLPVRDSLGFMGFKAQNVKIVNDVAVTNLEGEKEMIMVVDDEVHVMLLAKMMLAENGYKVVTAKDGFEALDNYKRLGKKIDLIILDFTMPGMHGDQVFEELRKLNPEVAVILSSGFADQAKLNRMFAQGLREFVAKPYTQQKLLTEIRGVLDARK